MAAVLERRPPHKLKQNDWLIKHAYNVTSQGGEDGVIAQIFQLLDQHEQSQSSPSPTNERRRWCVEFGAWNGKHLSNTWELLYNNAATWSGVLIEADAQRVQQMQQMYANHNNVTCVQSFIALDGDNRLAHILARVCPQLPVNLDLISIDVDGADYHIWAELEVYTPKVVIIEFNPTIPNNVVYIQERSTNIYHGSSLAALIDLGRKKGYELVCTTTFNAFFVQRQFYELFHIEDNSIDRMHDVPMPTEFFQLYDGTIKITGCKKLIWKKIPINERDIQVLSPSERAFPFLPSDHDALTAAGEYFEECKREKREDAEYFLRCGKEAFAKYRDEDIRRILNFAIAVCVDPNTQEAAVASVWAICHEFFQLELKRSSHIAAIGWLTEMLRVKPRCTAFERTLVLGNLGECYLRERDFEKAEFYLQTSIAIDPTAIGTLKSLAKLYTKTKQPGLTDEVVARIRSLMK